MHSRVWRSRFSTASLAFRGSWLLVGGWLLVEQAPYLNLFLVFASQNALSIRELAVSCFPCPFAPRQNALSGCLLSVVSPVHLHPASHPVFNEIMHMYIALRPTMRA